MVEKENSFLIFSTADWDAPYWTNKQHTATHLARMGFRVLYVESLGLRAPTLNRTDLKRIGVRLKKAFSPLKQRAQNVLVFSPLVIPFKHHWKITRTINERILTWQLNRFIKQLGFKNTIVWTYHPFIMELLDRVAHDKLVYHCVDDLTAVPGIDKIAFDKEEAALLMRCDAVFTTSETLRAHCATKNSNAHYFPNVADITHFGKAREAGDIPSDLSCIPSPRIGYVGELSDYKIDFSLILSIAKKKPEWHWVFIGDERAGQESILVRELRECPNVHFLGHRSYKVLPDYLRGFSVATLPTLLNTYTRAMFPMKYFEYLAAGLPIVSTPLAFTEQHQAGMVVAATAVYFSKAIQQQIDRGRLTDFEAEDGIKDNTWDARLTKMLRILDRL